VAELCREYGISRKTAYKWLARFRQTGTLGLVDASRRPHTSPTATADAVKAEILRQRQEHPTWGARKLRAVLMRTSGESTPSEACIHRIVLEAGLVPRRRRRALSAVHSIDVPKVEVTGPNDLWTVDFKGWWRTLDGYKCEPLTVRDAYSRFLLCLRGVRSTAYCTVRPEFELLFRRFGLPKAIQSDNGPPFAVVHSLAGLSKLSAWWISLGIQIVRSRPGCPQDNGGHERMHVDVYQDLQRKPARTLEVQQECFDGWIADFNHVRPHEALGMRTPAELYRPSSRPVPEFVVSSYPSNIRVVRVNRGNILHRQQKVYVSTVLAGHLLGLEERQDDVLVWFHHVCLGRFVPGEHASVQPLENPPRVAVRPSPRTKGQTTSSPAKTAEGITTLPGLLSVW
jgi:transposase InsO family protein